MPAAKMAPIKILCGDQELGRIESEQIMHVLMIEDNDGVRYATVRRLQALGYTVAAFPTPQEAAQALKPNAFQLVIADIRFQAPNISGDEFIFKNKDMFDEARIVAFTGHEDDIVYNDVFDEIFLKGKPNPDLYEYATNVYHERQKALARRFESELTDPSWMEAAEISRSAKEELVRTLNQTKDMDKKILWYKGRDFSANELIREVQDDTSTVGKSHIRMMMDWLTKKTRG